MRDEGEEGITWSQKIRDVIYEQPLIQEELLMDRCTTFPFEYSRHIQNNLKGWSWLFFQVNDKQWLSEKLVIFLFAYLQGKDKKINLTKYQKQINIFLQSKLRFVLQMQICTKF